MSVNLELYRVFSAVVRAGSISQAARNLYLSQPAVTQAIKLLEKELGGPLFFRNARGVLLTQEGELLYNYVQRALDILRAGEGHFQEMLNLERGVIRIGAGDSICKHYLLPYLDRFHVEYPNLEIHVTNRTTTETLPLLKSGEVDICFVNLPIADDPQLSVTECKPLHDCFIAGPKYYERLPQIHTLKDLSAHPVLLLERASNTRRQLDEHLEKLGVTLRTAVELGSLDLLVEFARIGLGFACVIEEFIQRELSEDIIRKVPLREPLPTRAIGLIHLSAIPVPHAAKQFMNLILHHPQ